MARISPKELSAAVAAASPGDHLELDDGEHVGQVVIDKPLVIEGRGASTWLGNRTGPVLIVCCPGVELRELQLEVTGELEHPAIQAERGCEPALHNVAIRRGELHVEGVLLHFAPPPPIRLRELTPAERSEAAAPVKPSAKAALAMTPRTVTSLALPPPPPQATPSPLAAAAAAAPPMAVASVAPRPRRASAAPSVGASMAAQKASKSVLASAASWVTASPRRARGYALAGVVAVGLGGVAWCAASGDAPAGARAVSTEVGAASASAATKRSGAAMADAASAAITPGGAAGDEAVELPAAVELVANSEHRTGIDVLGWSPDEESVLLEISYGRPGSQPSRWKVQALVDAASERVLRWRDVSTPPAKVVAGERESPSWSKAPEQFATDGLQRGSVLDPAQLDVRWCGNKKSGRYPTAARPRDGALELSWAAHGAQLRAETCRQGDFGQVLLQVKGSPWRLTRFLPWKGETSRVKVHRSPSGRRAVVIASFSLGDKQVARFYSRLLGPQIHVLANSPERRGEAMRLLGAPGLFLSENAQAPIAPPSRIMVRAGDVEALRVARSLQERLAQPLGLAEIEQVDVRRAPPLLKSAYLWGDVLIVLK